MKRLLIVVDYQNDFVNGPLGYRAAEELEAPICAKVKEYERDGVDVVFTRNIHGKDYLETEEGKNLPVPHCISGTGGEEFYGDVKKLASRHLIFEKITFGAARLGAYLLVHHYDVIELCGLDLSNSILANAIIAQASCPNAHVRILLGLSGCNDPEAMERTKKLVKRLHIEIVE